MRTLALFLSLAALTPALAQKRVITHEDVWLLKRTGEPVPSPDGKWIVFSLTEPDYDPAKTQTDLWLVPADGSAPPRRLTTGKGAESSPAWSPDSQRLAFTARRDNDEANQVYILHLAGGEALRATTISTGAMGPKWRPDGKAILFESMVKPDSDPKRKSTARVFDTFPIRYWNYWLDGSKPHVFIQDLEPGAKPKDLLAGTALAKSVGFNGQPNPAGSDRSLSPVWSPDGSEVVFAAVVNGDETMVAEVETHLFRIPAAGGEPKQITARGRSYSGPKFSPDGKTLYAHSAASATAAHPYTLTRLAAFAWPAAGAPNLLTANWDRGVGSFAVSPDSASVVFDAEDDGYDKLFRIPASGGPVTAVATPKEGGYAGPVFAGQRLIVRYGSSRQPNEIAQWDTAAGAHRLLTDFNRERLDQLDMNPPEHFWFTAKNGRKIHNLILFPPGFDKTKKYPIVVFPHGGPNSMSKDSFSTRWNMQLLVSPGYVLLQTNYTGSTGFGEKFADDIERDVLRGPAREILEAIPVAAQKYPWIDLTRQAAAGASYGGYLMNWFNGNTDQFKCLVNHAGAVNNESQYGINDGGIAREWRMGAPIWDFGKGQWQDQSPIRYAKNWKTPMLITQGELDFRVPLNESVTTYKILLRRKVPTRLMVYPDEGHWILKGENSRHHMEEILGWLKKYL